MGWGRSVAPLAAMVAAASAALAGTDRPGPIGSPEGPWREQMHAVPVREADGGIRLLQARLCRPQTERLARVALINHGSPPNAAARPTMKPTACDSEAAHWFLSRDHVVIAGLRRGYGAAGGRWMEGYGNCTAAEFAAAARETARDIDALVEYVATLPFVLPEGMIVIGQSAGGWGTIGYDGVPHIRVGAMINMAGGRGGHANGIANQVCKPDQLVEAAGLLGRQATTPMLWVYAANDSFFDPPLARAMFDAFTRYGGQAAFHPVAAFGNDGHGLFFGRGGSAVWGPLFERYLAERFR